MKVTAVKTNKLDESRAVANSIFQKKSNRKGEVGFAIKRPEAIAQQKLHELVNNGKQINQFNQLHKRPTSKNMIQMKPPSIYIGSEDKTPLDKDPNKWERPKWLLGASGGAATMREYVWGENPAGQALKEIENFKGESQIVYQCPICGDAVSFMGASVDHRKDWKEYAKAKGAKTKEELDYWYHDLDNLWIVHSGCNSSKGNVPLEKVLSREHTAISPSTWNREEEEIKVAKMIKIFMGKNEKNVALFSYLENLLTRIATRKLSAHNAVGILKRVMGEMEVEKALREV